MAEKERRQSILGRKSKKVSKLDTTRRNDIKDKPYVTKSVDSSIALLESPEDDVVMEALLHLSKFVDNQLKDLQYLQQRALLQKVVNLLYRNVCIVRLTLRLLGVLLSIDDMMLEINQDIYDEKIMKICSMYVAQTDPHITRFCVSILTKLAGSSRITCLIFKVDLLNPILDTIQKTTDMVLLELTLELFLKLLSAPAALAILPEMYNFDISILMMHLTNPEKQIAHLAYDIILKLTFYCLDVFQKMFKGAKLIERMLDVIMNPEDKEFQDKAFEIIHNSMNSDETSNYFIESLEFLKFCQWVKACEPYYLLPSIQIFEQLTKIPSRRQILFDLSVEDSILYFLRGLYKPILNKTCEAISNMTTHKYCCERMLTPVVLKEISNILVRKDTEDPQNEVALKTIIDFSRRDIKAIDMIHRYGVLKLLVGYFIRGPTDVTEESYLGVLEILYKISLHPAYQKELIESVETNFFEQLLHLFQTASVDIATFVCEILINFIGLTDFRQFFLSVNGPQIFVGVLQTSTDTKLVKNVLLFIHSCTIHNELMRTFLQNNLVIVLREFPEKLRARSPLINNILRQAYNFHLPLKFFETNRLKIIDRIVYQFYLIKGEWNAPFPFLEILDAVQVSTISTIYVVDYSFEIIKIVDDESISTGGGNTEGTRTMSSDWSTSTLSRGQWDGESTITSTSRSYTDNFLPRYIGDLHRVIDPSSPLEEQVKMIAEHVDTLLCGPNESYESEEEKMKVFNDHLTALKYKLESNIIPIGYLRMGFHCERALLFKAMADRCNIASALVKGKGDMYWNEVPLINLDNVKDTMKLYVVDLMGNVGDLLLVGTTPANRYCGLEWT